MFNVNEALQKPGVPSHTYNWDVFKDKSSYGYWTCRARKYRKFENAVSLLVGEMREYACNRAEEGTSLNMAVGLINTIDFHTIADKLIIMCDEPYSSIRH